MEHRNNKTAVALNTHRDVTKCPFCFKQKKKERKVWLGSRQNAQGMYTMLLAQNDEARALIDSEELEIKYLSYRKK